MTAWQIVGTIYTVSFFISWRLAAKNFYKEQLEDPKKFQDAVVGPAFVCALIWPAVLVIMAVIAIHDANLSGVIYRGLGRGMRRATIGPIVKNGPNPFILEKTDV